MKIKITEKELRSGCYTSGYSDQVQEFLNYVNSSRRVGIIHPKLEKPMKKLLVRHFWQTSCDAKIEELFQNKSPTILGDGEFRL